MRELLIEKFPSVPMTRSKGTVTRTVDWAKMSDDTLAHLIWHGLKQKANDPLGAKDLSHNDAVGLFNKVVDQFEANELRATAIRATDNYEKELRTLAIALAKTIAGKTNVKVMSDGKMTRAFTELVEKARANAALQAKARARADEMAELDSIEL